MKKTSASMRGVADTGFETTCRSSLFDPCTANRKRTSPCTPCGVFWVMTTQTKPSRTFFGELEDCTQNLPRPFSVALTNQPWLTACAQLHAHGSVSGCEPKQRACNKAAGPRPLHTPLHGVCITLLLRCVFTSSLVCANSCVCIYVYIYI